MGKVTIIVESDTLDTLDLYQKLMVSDFCDEATLSGEIDSPTTPEEKRVRVYMVPSDD